MRIPIQAKQFKIAAVLLGLIALSSGLLWYRSRAPQSIVGDETGEFRLADAADRSLDGEPALALTFTLPLDARKNYDKFIQVFEMPSRGRPALNTRPNEDDESNGPRHVSVVSTKAEDIATANGKVVSGAWVVGDNPRLLYFPHIKPEIRYVVAVAPGIEARNGSKLASNSSYSVQTAPVSPAYYFASNGTVLPARQNGGLPVVTVNVPEVDIQFLRVKGNKLPEFMDRVITRPRSRPKGDSEESEDGESYDYRRSSLKGAVGNYQLDAMRDLTDSIYLGRFTTEKKPNKRSVTYISVEDIRELAEPGVYVAVMSQPGRFRYDSQTTYFYVSDLGMQLRLFEKTADVFVSSLVTGRAIGGVETAWLDANGKTLATGVTDGDGHYAFAEIPKDSRLVMARKDKQVSIVALKEPALDLSEYDVVGPPTKPIRLFAYTGRDLYRPGESFDVSVLARDRDGHTVSAQPIQAVLKDPGGNRQFTTVWKPDMRFPGYYLKHLDLPADAATGKWTLELRADPADKTPGTSFRFGVEEFLPERMKLDLSSTLATVTADQVFAIAVRGSYLYGAPASNNRLLGVAEFERNKNPLAAKFPGFEFGDIREDSLKVRTELPAQSLDAEGAAQVRIELKDMAGKHSPFTVRGTVSLLESGGRPVIRSIERVVWPAAVMTGVRPLFTGDYAREGSRVEFEVLRSDRDGNLKSAAAMPVRLFRENRDYYWRFDDQRGWHSGFTETDELVQTTTVAIPAGGRGKLGVPVQYGRYRLEIDDRETNQLLTYRFYAGWSSQGDETQGVRPDRVALKLDKPNYREGETAHLTLTPPHHGEALITVEGDRTLWVKRTSISSDTATIDIPINREWKRHDLYVTVMVVRPGSEGSLVTPARALGLIYLPLDRTDRRLTVTLEAPQKVRPDTTINVKVKAPEAKGQMAFVTLSAVDAGILNITRFASPDPHGYFFGKLRYGADLHDVYGRLIEKMQGQKGQLRFGGDNTPTPSRGLPKIVQLVDLFSGPIPLDANGEAQIPLHAPDFNGTLRLMAVVAASDRFGSKDAEMTIAAPLITELATPRFLSFGDKAAMALDLQNLSGNAMDLKISLSGNGVQIQDSERNLTLNNQEKQTLRFPVEAGFVPGVHSITAKVSGANIKVERSFPLAIRPPTPQVQFARRYVVKPGESLDIQDANLSGLHRETVLAHFVVSDKPPIDVRGAVRDLLQYPYGCAEQTTSTAYPHIFIDEDEARRFGLKPFTREQRVDMLEKAVSKLAAMQAPNGGFSLWGNASEYDYWLSAYVTSFLVDARDQGFTVPDSVYNPAVDYLMRGLQEGTSRLPATRPQQPGPNSGTQIFRDYDNGRFDVLAHGAYVLAKGRKAPLATLRVLYDLRAQSQSGLALVHLGIALNLMGDTAKGNAAIAEGLSAGRTGHPTFDYYGTPLRDAALSYALLERHRIEAPGRENLLVLIANELGRNRYYSTQEKISLFFVGRSLSAGGNTWTASVLAGGRPEPVSRKGTYFRELSSSELSGGIKIGNSSKGTLYAELVVAGNPIQQPPPQSDPIDLVRSMYAADGRPLNGPLRVGDTVLVRLTVRSRTAMSTGLVVDRIPAGLEIENLNLVQGESLGAVTINGINPADAMMDSHIKHVEFRDDRFVAAVRLDAAYGNRYGGRDYGTLQLFYRARVVTPGQFIVPPLYAEDMYRPNIFGLFGGNETITVLDARWRPVMNFGEEKLPSWNRRGGPKGRGGSEVKRVAFRTKFFWLRPQLNKPGRTFFDLSTTPALRATPPVPGGEFSFLPIIHSFRGRPHSRVALGLVAFAVLLFVLDRCFPLPVPGRDSPYALVVVARDGTPLRAFPGEDHVWRHPVALSDVSPLYREALIAYEDKTFRWHPGVNPLALARAGWQWLTHGHVVSGGSTITMQVGRIIDPQPRTVKGKLIQIVRALQLELHYSKNEILEMYMNYAPMGGVLEGVEAASRGYLGKPSSRLTPAEAALLTVLPQSPSLLRPDRFAERAQAARNKVIRRMKGRWSQDVINDALTEPVYAQTVRSPLLAPLFAERMKRNAHGKTRVDTTIDAAMQSAVEGMLVDRARNLPPRVSIAAIVMDNATLEVLAYAGSADFTDKDRSSDVDMARSPRSPGSALKPFLYAFALDEGLIHSESLLSDVPRSFSGYEPGNFQQSFHGPVSVSEALVKSLNVPAVQVLDQLGPVRFVSMLRRGGLKLDFPRGAEPNLSVILGGAGTTLEDLVSAYSALARKGLAGEPRLVPDAPVQERRMMSEGAAFIVRGILENGGPVSQAMEGRDMYRGFAWKTGTSFGFRDAWAAGVSERYTIGVWVGRPDGTPNPGFFGANVAAPLLADIFSALPGGLDSAVPTMPSSVSEARICWPLGTRAAESSDRLCPMQRTAWLLDGTAPPTFPDNLQGGSPIYTYYVDQVTHLRVSPECAPHAVDTVETAHWPTMLEPWLDPGLRRQVLPPAWSAGCGDNYQSGQLIAIAGLNDGAVLHPAQGAAMPKARLEIRGSREKVDWMVNGRLVAHESATILNFPDPGSYDITAFDSHGHYDRIRVSVRTDR